MSRVTHFLAFTAEVEVFRSPERASHTFNSSIRLAHTGPVPNLPKGVRR
jgi:hypothetical protein